MNIRNLTAELARVAQVWTKNKGCNSRGFLTRMEARLINA